MHYKYKINISNLLISAIRGSYYTQTQLQCCISPCDPAACRRKGSNSLWRIHLFIVVVSSTVLMFSFCLVLSGQEVPHVWAEDAAGGKRTKDQWPNKCTTCADVTWCHVMSSSSRLRGVERRSSCRGRQHVMLTLSCRWRWHTTFTCRRSCEWCKLYVTITSHESYHVTSAGGHWHTVTWLRLNPDDLQHNTTQSFDY